MREEITVTLASRWIAYLQGLAADRRFESIDHAIEDALRLLEATEDKDDRLTQLLVEGERSPDAGSWDLDAFLREARERDAGRKRLRHQSAAHDDLLGIWRYTSLVWDREQADAYLAEIDRVLQGIAAGELSGTLHEFRYLKRRVGPHIIYYRDNDREIVVIRVLHVSMNSKRHLSG